MKTLLRVMVLVLVPHALIPADPARAQDLLIPRIGAPIELDGEVTEAAWLALEALPLTMFEPRFKGAITRRSDIRVAHDGTYLYASGVFEDEGPLRADGLVRDFDAEDDVFNLVLDTFRDRRTALWFAVNPAGARLDGAITDDAEGASWNHVEYDSHWDARAAIHPWGWSAELRIPLASLRLRSEDGRAVIGLIAGRKIARIRERYTFPATPPGPGFAQFKPSLAATAVLEEVVGQAARVLSPWVSSGWEGGTGPTGAWSARRKLGGDVKLGVGQDLVLDLTLNTDFAQAEVDDQRVNLTRFDVLYPERRSFFLERAGAFDFGDGQVHRLFHSRRVGLGDDGAPLPVRAGSRLTGRVGAWDLGALAIATGTPGGGTATSAAARVRRPLGHGTSWVGAVVTGVRGADGVLTAASGLDADLRLGGHRYLNVTLAASDTAGRADRDATHVRVVVEDRDRQGLSYRVEAAHLGGGYRPPLGFVLRRGRVVRGEVAHGVLGRGGPFQERIVSIGGAAHWRSGGGALESAEATGRLTLLRSGGGEGRALLRINREDLTERFALSPSAGVGPGSYTFVDGELELTTPAGRPWTGTLSLRGGGFYDGGRLTAGLTQGWVVSRHLSIQGDIEWNRVRFARRAETFDGVLTRVRVAFAANSRLSGSATAQFQSDAHLGGVSMRVRYNFRDGEDLYLVLNGGAHGDDTRGARRSWEWTRRTALVKYSYAVRW